MILINIIIADFYLYIIFISWSFLFKHNTSAAVADFESESKVRPMPSEIILGPRMIPKRVR